MHEIRPYHQQSQEFPELEEEDIGQAFIFASSYLDDRIIELPQSDEIAEPSRVCMRRLPLVKEG